ncbi:hypothetical protein G3N58_31185 [Paraburkholderia sp. Ac-20342]|uniref:hypothetical protein n=1 Tax=unclassified Paraburkholderia TaxID=2615204 RepID=UPI00142422D9|nr:MULTISPECIES: hypothetical protein [unclassified Paraburkholderia]MBN3851252.1 hypothetical protein [Paraburkholderia sp. Ac-20342]NIF80794.1 hypothetical protein [Paraburkholderia sp. Cy-641]
MLDEKWDELRIPREIAISFWAKFARAEFSLKATRFAAGNEGGSAYPAWDKFGSEVAAALDPWADPELAKAVKYLLDRPPRKQIVRGERACFEDIASAAGRRTEIESALVLMRRVRNNLFHGGKYFDHDDANRDLNLMKASMTVLEACVNQIGDVRLAYETGDA